MAYVVNQPTLISPWPELDSFVRSLGPFLACAWCALERSRTASAPVAAGTLGSEALDTLASLQVLERACIEGSTFAARSLYEPLAWNYHHRWSRPGVNLEALLMDILARWTADCPIEAKRRLGASLSESDARAYLANLLRKHRLPPSLGDGLRSTQLMEWHALGLGRKRYVLWASLRNTASQLLQRDMTDATIRQMLDREINSRTIWLLRRAQSGMLATSDFCFVPAQGWRKPLILDIAMETFLPLGQEYWLEPAGHWRL